MRKIGFTLLVAVALIVGCKARQPTYNLPPVRHTQRTVTKLVPFYVPADSTALQAYFECDSLNNVLLKWMNENKTSRMDSNFDFDGSLLSYNAKAQPDTLYLPSDTVFIEVNEPYPVEVEKIEYQQTWWQRIFYMIGIIASTAVAVWVITKIGMKRFI